MKIGLLIYGSLETLSGGYLYDRELAAHLEQEGDAVQVISLPWRDYARHLGDNLSPALFERLKGLDVDVMLQDELNHPSLFWTNQRLRRRLTYPNVAIVHHLRSSERRPTWQNRLYARVESAYLRSVDGFVFNSHTTQTAVEALAGAGRPAVVAYPAADHLNAQIEDEEIVRRARRAGPLVLLFVGNLIPRKGLHTLLEALARLPQNAFKLDVAGSLSVDPAYAAAIQRRITALDLDASVHLHGALSGAALVELYRRAHALALPSSYEGFGIVYLEAMGFGLPCIATTAGAAGEVIADDQTGWLIPPEDASALAGRLQRLAGDSGLLERMSLAARQRYLAHPTWEQTADKVKDFLRDLV